MQSLFDHHEPSRHRSAFPRDEPTRCGEFEFEHLTTTERIDLAKTTMGRVLDHFLYLLELHANNSFVVYSPTLISQIPRSFAANAFNVFQRSMYQIEIVRLCAIWDKADPMMAHIAMMRALHRHKPKAAPVPRRKRAKAYRIIR